MMLPLVAALTFLSGALLFMVQPMLGKMILPLFGGAPAVWITLLAFFQVTLLASYLYVHATSAWLGARKQAVLHGVLLLIPLVLLPIRIRGGFGAASELHPVSSVFLILLASVGLPFFVVSATAPSLQRWFGGTAVTKARDPFFFYTISNLGGILALLAYPNIVEQRLPLDTQSRVWTVGYGLFVALTIACLVLARRSLPVVAESPETIVDEPPIHWRTRLRWIALAAVPSSLLLSVTTHITTNIAPLALLWVAPLALYVLSLVIAFSPRLELLRALARYVFPFVVLVPLAITISGINESPGFMLLHLLAFAVAALLCHGDLAASRPGIKRLTEFHVWLALGAAIGSLFNVIIAPVIFRTAFEYPLGLILACLAMRWPSKWAGRAHPWTRNIAFAAGIALVALGASKVVARFSPDSNETVAARERSFYGSYRIVDRPYYKILYQGNANHGAQAHDLNQRCAPLSYYHPTGPLGNIFASFSRGMIPRSNVGIIGLGTGSIGGYWLKGQSWTFYETDPTVEKIARNPLYFSFLADCVPNARVVVGDARISLAKAPDMAHDLIIVDALGSGAIPVHLLTQEAMRLYLRKLAPRGVLAFNISNQYLNLRYQFARLARDNGLVAYLRDDSEETEVQANEGKIPSVWVAMARADEDLGVLPRHPLWGVFPKDVTGPAWTDNYSNTLEVLHLR